MKRERTEPLKRQDFLDLAERRYSSRWPPAKMNESVKDSEATDAA